MFNKQLWVNNPASLFRISFFSLMSVCLSVCLWTGYLKKLCTDSGEIWWIGLGVWQGRNYSILVKICIWIWEFLCDSSLLSDRAKSHIYSMISQKVMAGFGRNLVDKLGAWQGWIYSILVKIWMWIRIREFLFLIFQVIIHHWEMGKNTVYSMIFQKVMDGLWHNLVEEFGKWWEQADKILVQVWIQIGLSVGYKT